MAASYDFASLGLPDPNRPPAIRTVGFEVPQHIIEELKSQGYDPEKEDLNTSKDSIPEDSDLELLPPELRKSPHKMQLKLEETVIASPKRKFRPHRSPSLPNLEHRHSSSPRKQRHKHHRRGKSDATSKDSAPEGPKTAEEKECEECQNQEPKPQEEQPLQVPLKRHREDFQLGRHLGEGSFAIVREARDIHTGKIYAIKMLDKNRMIAENKVEAVNCEKRVLNELHHSNIACLYYTFQDPQYLYFVLDLCPNGELFDLIKKCGRLELPVAVFYSAQILESIEYLHSKGIIHRDLKPENILLDSKMHVKLNDFGTAKVIGTEPGARANTFIGTPEYMPPEMLVKPGHTNFKSDIWAFGCIVYQLLLGRPPFKGETEYQTMKLISDMEWSLPLGEEKFPDQAEALIDWILVSDPESRPSISEIKAHSFFEGIGWGSLQDQVAPKADFKPPEESPKKSNPETVNTARNVLNAHLVEIQKKRDVQFLRFLEDDEDIIHSGIVMKQKGMSKKRRKLILTNKPRLFYVHPDKMALEGEVEWSDDISITLGKEQQRKFCINTKKRAFHFRDISGYPTEWRDAIENLKSSKK